MRRPDRLTLLDNALADVDRSTGGRPVSRRQFIRTSGGLFLFSVAPMPVSIGCDTETVNQILRVAFLLAETAKLVGSLIDGDMRIDNPNTVCRTYDIAVKLAEAAGSTVMEPLQEKRICDAQNNFSLEDWALTPQTAGGHILSTILDGNSFSTPTFSVSS